MRKNLPLDSKFIVIRDDNQRYGRIYTYLGANTLYRFVCNLYSVRPRVIKHFYQEVVLEELLRTSTDNVLEDYQPTGACLRFANLEDYLLGCKYRNVKSGIDYNLSDNPLNLPTDTFKTLVKVNYPNDWLKRLRALERAKNER